MNNPGQLIKNEIFSGFKNAPELNLEGRRGQNGVQSLRRELTFTKNG